MVNPSFKIRFSINSGKVIVAKNPNQTFVKDVLTLNCCESLCSMLKALAYSDLKYKYCSIEFRYNVMSSVSVHDLCLLYSACVVHHAMRH